MMLTGKEAMEKLQEKLQYDTEHDAFVINSTDLIIDYNNKSPHAVDECGGEEAEQ